MMLFELSFKNMKKSFKDYAVYFMTLVLGVSIFYIFNSIGSQEARLALENSDRDVIGLLKNLLSGLSVFISVILGFLIVYANNFLIKRRKKEFGIYMLLGMSRQQVSQILVIETVLIGFISLGVGLLAGVFASQFISVLVAKMFEVDMTEFQFVFSASAFAKTLLYFGIMYLAVLVFNTVSVSKYKLIDLFAAARKNERVRMKNTLLCVLVFIASVCILAWAYYKVTVDFESLITESLFVLLPPVAAGCIGTFLFFWSLSGFLLQAVQSNKSVYLRETNIFVMRQLNNKINTAVLSMTIICLMLFVTICALASAISLNDSFKKSVRELTPVDVQITKTLKTKDIHSLLAEKGFDVNSKLRDAVFYNKYRVEGLTMGSTLGLSTEDAEYLYFYTHMEETLMKLSDYNKIAALYGTEEFFLSDDEYLIIADYPPVVKKRNMGLQSGTTVKIGEKLYTPKYSECKTAFVDMSANRSNSGIIILPDSALEDACADSSGMVANYNVSGGKAERAALEADLIKTIRYGRTGLSINTKLDIYSAATGLSAVAIFLAFYLGITFLIAGGAVLALKELADSSDNRQRYGILRKIGADERLINKTLFIQTAVFFLMPLVLAVVHSVFGITFALKVLETINSVEGLIGPIIISAVIIILVYGGYFTVTYFGSRSIISED